MIDAMANSRSDQVRMKHRFLALLPVILLIVLAVIFLQDNDLIAGKFTAPFQHAVDTTSIALETAVPGIGLGVLAVVAVFILLIYLVFRWAV